MNLFVVTQRDPLFVDQFLKNIDGVIFDKVVVFNAPNFGSGKLRGLKKFWRLFGFLQTLRATATSLLDFRGLPKGFEIVNEDWETIENLLLNRSAADGSDWLLSVSAPHKISMNVLRRFKTRLNFHCGRLPDYAGMMPMFWQAYRGEARYTVTMHELAAEIDEGDILFEWSRSFSSSLYASMQISKVESAMIFNLYACGKIFAERRKQKSTGMFNRYPSAIEIRDFKENRCLKAF